MSPLEPQRERLRASIAKALADFGLPPSTTLAGLRAYLEACQREDVDEGTIKRVSATVVALTLLGMMADA